MRRVHGWIFLLWLGRYHLQSMRRWSLFQRNQRNGLHRLRRWLILQHSRSDFLHAVRRGNCDRIASPNQLPFVRSRHVRQLHWLAPMLRLPERILPVSTVGLQLRRMLPRNHHGHPCASQLLGVWRGKIRRVQWIVFMR